MRRYRMGTFSALLALCERNPSVTGVLPSQKDITMELWRFFDVRLNKWSKQTIAGDLRHHDTDMTSL